MNWHVDLPMLDHERNKARRWSPSTIHNPGELDLVTQSQLIHLCEGHEVAKPLRPQSRAVDPL